MYMTQQAMSNQIAALESDMGVQLFSRSRNGVELTRAGKRFYTLFKDFQMRYEVLLGEVTREGGDKAKKSIRVGFQNWLNINPVVRNVKRQLSETKSSLIFEGQVFSPGVLFTMLERDDLDLIVIVKRFFPEEHDYEAFLLLETNTQLIVSAEDPICERAREDYKVLAERTMLIDLMPGEPPSAATRKFLYKIREYGFTPKDILFLPNRDTAFMETDLGRGVTIATPLSRLPANTSLARFDTPVRESLYCAWKREGKDTEMIKAAASLLKREFERQTNQD
jgi:DNA-binding transcriptional LysR family regulator